MFTVVFSYIYGFLNMHPSTVHTLITLDLTLLFILYQWVFVVC